MGDIITGLGKVLWGRVVNIEGYEKWALTVIIVSLLSVAASGDKGLVFLDLGYFSSAIIEGIAHLLSCIQL